MQGPAVILFAGSLSQGTNSLAIELKTHARDARGYIPIGDYRGVDQLGDMKNLLPTFEISGWPRVSSWVRAIFVLRT